LISIAKRMMLNGNAKGHEWHVKGGRMARQRRMNGKAKEDEWQCKGG